MKTCVKVYTVMKKDALWPVRRLGRVSGFRMHFLPFFASNNSIICGKTRGCVYDSSVLYIAVYSFLFCGLPSVLHVILRLLIIT